MHEFSLAEQILDFALALSRDHGYAPVKRVVVEIGALQAVVPDSLQFAFEAAARETVAEGAVLEWREIAALVECPACRHTYVPPDIIWACPDCGTSGGRAIRGDDLVITCVELAERAPTQESFVDA